MASTLSGLVLCLLVTTVVASEYTFEFGDAHGGDLVDEKSGVIPPFQYSTYVTVNAPSSMRLSYVKVIIDALAPPTVKFDFETKTVSIKYSFEEVTVSTYKIYAKAKPDDDDDDDDDDDYDG